MLSSKQDFINLSGRKIALFAGSFNPPTLGHLSAAEAALAHVDLVIFFPDSNNPRKQHELVDLHSRVSYIQTLLNGSVNREKLLICNPDFLNGLPQQEKQFSDLETLLGSQQNIYLLAGHDRVTHSSYPSFYWQYSHLIVSRQSPDVQTNQHNFADRKNCRTINPEHIHMSSKQVRHGNHKVRRKFLGNTLFNEIKQNKHYPMQAEDNHLKMIKSHRN